MTSWHDATDPPHKAIPEVEILFWDGCYVCRIFGGYDHDEGAWYVGGEPLIDEDTPDWEVWYWAIPRLLPTEAHERQKQRQLEQDND